jgi:hypothetical protein
MNLLKPASVLYLNGFNRRFAGNENRLGEVWFNQED